MSATTESISKIAGLEIIKAEDVDDFIKLLVYGDAGVGKSWLVASAEEVPEMRPILYIDMEGGIKSIKERWPGLNIVRIRDTINESTGVVTKMAWEHLYELYENLKTKPHPYKTIILDSITEAYSVCMKWVMHLLIHGSNHSKPKPDRDPDIPDKREYNKARSRAHLMVKSFRDLDLHVLMTAHKDVKTNNDTGAVINYLPAVPGKLAYDLSGIVDELLFMYIETKGDDVVRKLLTKPLNKYLAKDRSDALETVVDDPTMPSLAKLWLRKGDTKPASTKTTTATDK